MTQPAPRGDPPPARRIAAMPLTLHNDRQNGTISQKNDAGIPQLRIFIRQNLPGDLHHIGAGDVGTREERVERHAGTRNECCGATGA